MRGILSRFRCAQNLTRQLGEPGAEDENLRITRKTLLTLLLPSPPTWPDRPASRIIPPVSGSTL
jgi:hypothetical protein